MIDAEDLRAVYPAALRADGHERLAVAAERDSQWWLTYSVALSQIPPGSVKPEWER